MNACRRPSSRIVMHVYTFFTNYVQGVAEIEIGSSIGILYSTLVSLPCKTNLLRIKKPGPNYDR